MSLHGNTRGGPTVGIDIGTNQIKVAEAKPGKDGIHITALGFAPTPPGTVENDIIVDPVVLGKAIKDLMKSCNVSTNKSVSSVSGQSSVVVRIIELPKMTKEELDKTMQWEVERHVPFSANEVVMDFQPIERPIPVTDDQNMEVLLAVAQQDVINNHVKTLFEAGLDPVAIEVEQVAISRTLLEIPQTEKNDSIIIINIGAEGTEIGIFHQGLLAFPRTVPIAGDTISRAISDAFGVSIEEAEQIKLSKAVILPERAAQFSGAGIMPGIDSFGVSDDSTAAFSIPAADNASDIDLGFIPGLGYSDAPAEPNPDQPTISSDGPEFDIGFDASDSNAKTPEFDYNFGGDLASSGLDSGIGIDQNSSFQIGGDMNEEQIFDAMAPVIMDLLSEVRRSLDYYSGKFQTFPDTVMLCGGTAKMQGLAQLIQNELGLPVKIAKPRNDIKVSSNALSQGNLEEVATIFPVSLGLAVRDMIGE